MQILITDIKNLWLRCFGISVTLFLCQHFLAAFCLYKFGTNQTHEVARISYKCGSEYTNEVKYANSLWLVRHQYGGGRRYAGVNFNVIPGAIQGDRCRFNPTTATLRRSCESTIGSDRYEITVQGLCVFSTVKVMFTYMERPDYQFVFLQKTGAVSVGNYASPDSKWIAKHSVVAYGINVVPSLKWIVFWWCAALIFGVVHCAAIRTLRVRRSLCVHCGYAKRQVGLCPECGRSDKVV